MNMVDDHWLMCVHEAAHAFIFCGDGGGLALVSDSLTAFGGGGPRSAESRIRVALAGAAAEMIAMGEESDLEELGIEDIALAVRFRLEHEIEQRYLGQIPHGSNETDGEAVFRMLQDLRKTSVAQNRLLQKLTLETVRAVSAAWTEIEELAREVSKTLHDSPDGVYVYQGGLRLGP